MLKLEKEKVESEALYLQLLEVAEQYGYVPDDAGWSLENAANSIIDHKYAWYLNEEKIEECG